MDSKHIREWQKGGSIMVALIWILVAEILIVPATVIAGIIEHHDREVEYQKMLRKRLDAEVRARAERNRASVLQIMNEEK